MRGPSPLRLVLALAIVGAVFVLRAYRSPQPTSDEGAVTGIAQNEEVVRQAITDRLEMYREAVLGGDPVMAGSLFASDALLLEPGVRVSGREILALHEEVMWTMEVLAYEVEVAEVFVQKDAAYSILTETVTSRLEGQEPTTMANNAFLRWIMEDGVWKVHRAVVGPEDAPVEG